MNLTIAQVNTESGESLNKGKKLTSFDVYKRMCELTLEGDVDDYLFDHTFNANPLNDI